MNKKKPTRSLGRLWSSIELGQATEEDKIEAAWMTGEAHDSSRVQDLVALLDDAADEVRYYALQALVLDLQQTGPRFVGLCWGFLQTDPDEEVRSMAAACLGKIYFNRASPEVFRSMVAELKDDGQSQYVKGSIYSSLFKFAGRPPAEWPGLEQPRSVFSESDIDWQKIAELEDAVLAESTRPDE